VEQGTKKKRLKRAKKKNTKGNDEKEDTVE
jgi:hypothetical protein